MRMITQKTTDAIKARSNGRPVSFFGLFDLPLFTNDDLEAAKDIYKPLMPQGDNVLDLSLVLGGLLVFRGEEQIYRHRDAGVAVHATLDKVLGALSSEAGVEVAEPAAA
mmetsp:Transcript_94929/g.247774  ORF Transcript_94929/g.247774 Transcript_94929/m.247774 type:complete len:109 (+) Transcript_94929:403-729(+)